MNNKLLRLYEQFHFIGNTNSIRFAHPPLMVCLPSLNSSSVNTEIARQAHLIFSALQIQRQKVLCALKHGSTAMTLSPTPSSSCLFPRITQLSSAVSTQEKKTYCSKELRIHAMNMCAHMHSTDPLDLKNLSQYPVIILLR